jgi:predicted DNA-binding helix-hairpin-helix protein
LDEELDPKSAWALRHFERFPVEIMRADYEALLRVPGIGVRSAKRILATRRVAPLRVEHLRKLGVVMKRARHFLTCNGMYAGDTRLGPSGIKPLILPGPGAKYQPVSPATQPELFGEL